MTDVAPTSETVHDTGIEIRYWDPETDSAVANAYVKRHYKIRGVANIDGTKFEHPWHQVPSITEVLGILKKEQLISWAQRTGAIGTVQLANMGLLKFVDYNGQPVLGAHFKDKGWVVVGENEIIELLKKNRLTTDSKKKAGGKRGGSVHGALELWAEQGVIPNPNEYPLTEQGYIAGLRKFLDDCGGAVRPVRWETMVASIEDGFAGRFDLDLECERSVKLMTHWTPAGRGNTYETFEAGMLLRTDLKTSKGVFDEHTEQLEGYEKGCVECGVPASDMRVVLNVTDNGMYRFKPSWSTYADFKATLDKYKLNQERKERKKHA